MKKPEEIKKGLEIAVSLHGRSATLTRRVQDASRYT